MLRRSFIKHTALAAGLAQVSPFFFGNYQAKVGVMSPLFSLSGYNLKPIANLKNYTSHAEAQNDLINGKIDILISSPEYLTKHSGRLSLFGSFPAPEVTTETKENWILKNYSVVNKHYATLGLQSEYAASFAPIYIRMTRLTDEEMQDWQYHAPRTKMAATQLRSTWFSHLGFNVQSGGMKDQLSKQLINLHDGRLHIADAFTPALYLRAALHIKEIENVDSLELKSLIDQVKKQGPDAHYIKMLSDFSIYKDTVTRSAVPFEILYRAENQKNIRNEADLLKKEILNLANQDNAIQKQSLEILVNTLGLKYNDSLPETLKSEIVKCAKVTTDVMLEIDPNIGSLVQSYKSLTFKT